MRQLPETNQYDRVRRAVEAKGRVDNENALRSMLIDEGYDPALVARALSERRWQRGPARRRFGTGALVLGYAMYGLYAAVTFMFLLTRPDGLVPPTQGLILAAIALVAAGLLVVARRQGIAVGVVAGFVVLTLISSGSATLLTDRYEAVERSVLLYPAIGAVGALFWSLFRRIP